MSMLRESEQKHYVPGDPSKTNYYFCRGCVGTDVDEKIGFSEKASSIFFTLEGSIC